jgi:polynucleotide 5'-hydroxyl-kinase GRC3/NOL9
MTQHRLKPQHALVVAGPGSIVLLEGAADILAAPLRVGRKVVVRSERQVPILAENECLLEVSLGEGAQVAEYPNTTIPASWNAAYEALGEIGEGVFVVVGGTDVGKSTLCTFLINSIHLSGRGVVFIDADIGQTDLGPPTTIGGTGINGPVETVSSLAPDKLYFAGDNSPGRITDRVIAGIRKIVEALEIADRVCIINTDGWIDDDLALLYKVRLLNDVHPSMVVGIESEPVRQILAVSKWPSLLVQPSEIVRYRSRLDRKVLRQYGYRRYLENSKVWAYPANPDTVRLVVGTAEPEISPATAIDLRNLIVGLLDRQGFALGVGILLEYDRRHGVVKIHSSPQDAVAKIEIGNVRLTPDGVEIGYLYEH